MKSLPLAALVAMSIAGHLGGSSEVLAAPIAPATPAAEPRTFPASVLASRLEVGDVVFIRIDVKPFREVADATNSWTNHVGIVVDVSGSEPLIGESKLPWSRTTPLSDFVSRSENRRVLVARLNEELTPKQQLRVVDAAKRRNGILYDTGFNLHSRRQFCSRYVHEILLEATGTSVGDVETFARLLASRPDANVGFWRAWFFGSIPWERETVTPASLLRSPMLRTVFDGAGDEKRPPAGPPPGTGRSR
jgi:hypothetical protein